MNDRFKFRIFLKAHNQMCNVHTLHTGTNKVIISTRYGNSSVQINDYNILMQSTGLKDKNGNLIYEGDILKIFHVSSTGQGRLDIRYVVYDEDKARFIFCENGYMSYITVDTDDVCEVIGNIYENLELLEVSE